MAEQITNKVFLSWSGDRSKAAATALRKWLPNVIQIAKPWMSSRDIGSGTISIAEILRGLEGAKIGIICLTKANWKEPWINFESGALLRLPEGKSYVCTLLLDDLAHAQLENPLAMFQWTKANDKDRMRKLIQDINTYFEGSPLDAETLSTVFDKWWPDLERDLQNLPVETTAAPQSRDDKDFAKDTLELLRAVVPLIDEIHQESSYSRTTRQIQTGLFAIAPNTINASVAGLPAGNVSFNTFRIPGAPYGEAPGEPPNANETLAERVKQHRRATLQPRKPEKK